MIKWLKYLVNKHPHFSLAKCNLKYEDSQWTKF